MYIMPTCPDLLPASGSDGLQQKKFWEASECHSLPRVSHVAKLTIPIVCVCVCVAQVQLRHE